MELFVPPMGTAQEERVVGGWGMEVDGAQDILGGMLAVRGVFFVGY